MHRKYLFLIIAKFGDLDANLGFIFFITATVSNLGADSYGIISGYLSFIMLEVTRVH